MTRFVVSDHHFNHSNIIEYCNRPFETKSDMNSYMIERWNNVVGQDDVVLHIGDVAFGSKSNVPEKFLNKLNGRKIVILGNHDDSINQSTFPYPTFESTICRYKGYRFWCTHRPEDVPEYWTEWVIHGHSHNNKPLIDYQKNRLNVSVENIEYTPVPLGELVKTLNNMSNQHKVDDIQDEPFCNNEWYKENI